MEKRLQKAQYMLEKATNWFPLDKKISLMFISEHVTLLYDIRHFRGRIKPSFRFMERLNKSIMCTSLELVKEVLSMFTLSENTQQVLTSENVSYASLVGAAVYTHGNSATTFVEQARLTGMTTKYLNYLEENGLADVVPRMEAHYLNPSPWAEKEVYEDEFNQILKEVTSKKFLIYFIDL